MNTLARFSSQLLTYLFIFALITTVAKADVFNVTNEIELQNALDFAGSNFEDDTIAIQPGVYFTPAAPFVYLPDATENFSLTIIGEDSSNTILDGNNDDGILVIDVGAVPATTNITIEINDLTFRNGSSGMDGGAISFFKGCDVNIHDNIFVDNVAFTDGGALDFNGDDFVAMIKDNLFDGNFALDDGGAFYASSVDSNFTFYNNVFDFNRVTQELPGVHEGGAIYCNCDRMTFKAQKNMFSRNSANDNGGAVFLMGTISDILFEENDFTDNVVGLTGGAVYIGNSENTINFNYNNFSNNMAEEPGSMGGGAVYIQVLNDVVNFLSNSFSSNSTEGKGGAINLAGDDPVNTSFRNNVFYGNIAKDSGGAVNIDLITSVLNFINNTLTLNATNNDGGGLSLGTTNDNAVANIYNNIIYQNTAFDDGDDIYINDDVDANNFGSAIILGFNDFINFVSVCVTEPGCVSDITQAGNISENPDFKDPEDGDFRLEGDSPARNAGFEDAPALPEMDFARNDRIIGSSPDMGAFEFLSSSGGNGGCSLASTSAGGFSFPLVLLLPLIVLVYRFRKNRA